MKNSLVSPSYFIPKVYMSTPPAPLCANPPCTPIPHVSPSAPAPESSKTQSICSPSGKLNSFGTQLGYSLGSMFGMGVAFDNLGASPQGAANVTKAENQLQQMVNSANLAALQAEAGMLEELEQFTQITNEALQQYIDFKSEILNDEIGSQKLILVGVAIVLLMVVIFLLYN